MKGINYFGKWIRNWYDIFVNELKLIFTDAGVLIIFFVGGLLYPVLYNLIYMNGTVDEMPVAVAHSAGVISRKWMPPVNVRFSVPVLPWKKPAI